MMATSSSRPISSMTSMIVACPTGGISHDSLSCICSSVPTPSVFGRGRSSAAKSNGDFSAVEGVLEDPDAPVVSMYTTRLAVAVNSGTRSGPGLHLGRIRGTDQIE
ncbi:hypothetical protein Tco_1142815 [Tanacetum coccineum]